MATRLRFRNRQEYISPRPTQERRRLYTFMERHKTQGIVSGKRLNEYIEKKGYRVGPYRKIRNPRTIKQELHNQIHPDFEIRNRRGTRLMAGNVNRRRQVNWWAVN